jgi:flagellin
MTRINTNVSSLTAQQYLARANDQLQIAMTRLSTGLRINSGKDDPAGLIASEALNSDIISTQKAISNSQRANQVISTADSALGQVSTLLNNIRGLVTEAANKGAMSADQIAANQLQIDSSLDAINRIAQSTSFQGRNLLDGSLDFLVSGATVTSGSNNFDLVKNLQVNQVNMGTQSHVAVDMKVTTAAAKATIATTLPEGTPATAELEFAGSGGMTITAPDGSAKYNNTSVQIKESASVSTASPLASYDSDTNILTITVNNSAATASSAIAEAIGKYTDFTVPASGDGSPVGNYTPGVDSPSVYAFNTLTTADGGILKISAKTVDSSWNDTQITFDMTGTSATPVVTYTAGTGGNPGTLNIKVNKNAPTNLQTIADAINNSTDEDVQQFASQVQKSGSVNPTLDGASTVVGVAATTTLTIGVGSTPIILTIDAVAPGALGNGLKINVVEKRAADPTATTTSAVYDSSYNTDGANGLLTISLANHLAVDSDDVLDAIQSSLKDTAGDDATAAFAAKYTASANTAGSITTDTTTALGKMTDTLTTANGDVAVYSTGSSAGITGADGLNELTITATATHYDTAAPVVTYDGLIVNVTQADPGTTTTTAVYDESGANPTLTITLGNGTSISLSDLNQIIANATAKDEDTTEAMLTAFKDNYTVLATLDAGSVFVTNSTAEKTGTNASEMTQNGVNPINGLNGLMGGAGVGATMATTTPGGLTGDLVVQIGGNKGSQVFSFLSGTTAAQIVSAVNSTSDSTGVAAQVVGGDLQLLSVDYGNDAFVNVNIIKDKGSFSAGLDSTHAIGTDIAGTVNSQTAIGRGNTISFNTSSLSFLASIEAGTAVDTQISFDINGGGALFQLGPNVISSEQARLGVQSVDSAKLGGANGRLYQLGSGQDASLTKDLTLAAQIVTESVTQVANLRGRLGAFQNSTVQTNINSLNDTLSNLTDAKSTITDADFAAETANLTRAQILSQSGTAVLSIANKNPQNVLSLLR